MHQLTAPTKTLRKEANLAGLLSVCRFSLSCPLLSKDTTYLDVLQLFFEPEE